MKNRLEGDKLRLCGSMKSLISVALLVGFAGTAAAGEVRVTHKDSTGTVLNKETVILSSKSELRMYENIKREFAEARGKHFANDKPGGEIKFISACYRVEMALTTRGPGGKKLRGNDIHIGDKIELEVPIKIVGPNIENILLKVCKGTGVDDSKPDNAASQTAIDIHGGYSCHDENNQVEETHGANQPITGTTCGGAGDPQ